MAYDLATKPEVRHQTVEGFVAIKDQVADDPTSIFPMFKEIVIEEATGLSTDNFSELDVGTGRGQHLACKGTVRTVATVLAGGKFLSKLPKMADDLAAKLLNAKLWKKFKKAPGFTDEMLIAFKKNLKELLEKIPEATESMIKIADFTSASELMDIVAKLNKLKELDGITAQ